MKFFTNKSIWSKIIIVLIFVLLFEFVVTKPTLGAEVTDNIVEGGGKLLIPILSLVASIGDALMGITQNAILGTDASIYPVDVEASFWEILGKIFVVAVAVVAAIATVVAAVASGVGVVALIGTIGSALAKAAATVVIGTIVVDIASSSSSAPISNVSASVFSEDVKVPATLYLPVFNYSPEEIFQGKILLFNVDFFGDPIKISQDSEGNWYYTNDKGEKVITSRQNIAEDLSGVISKWYVGIRNIALVTMMIVLLYIGIRMLLSTLASDKAKYRQMIQDWLVGLMLLFLMHYIMAFSVTLVQSLTDIVATGVDQNTYAVRFPVDSNGKIVKWFNENDLSYMLYGKDGSQLTEDPTVDVNSGDVAYVSYPTNLLGKLRLELQFDTGGFNYVGYTICYLVLVFFTLYFTFVYLRRVLYMAFLTLIAPVVAVTYPIDKINDGSAQGFSKWFREYIFNLLIQPMHLLLYYILITSAFQLAGQNIIYSIVAIGFMIPAEKLLRSLFGFEKASTSSALNGATGAALAMGGISKLASLGRKGGSSAGSSGGGKTRTVSGNSGTKTIGGSDDSSGPINRSTNGDDDFDEVSSMAEGTSADSYQEIDESQEALDGLRQEGKQAKHMNYNKAQEELDLRRDRLDANISNDNLETSKYSPSAMKDAMKENKKKLSMPKRALSRTHVFLSGHKEQMAKAARMVTKASSVAAGVGVGLTAGAIGAAVGVATGDPSDVPRNIGAGAGAGYLAGRGLTSTDSAMNRLVDNTSNLDKEEYYQKLATKGPEYKEYAQERYAKLKSKEYKEALKKNNFDKDEIKRMEKDGTINRYILNDVDAQDAATAELMRKDDKSITQEQAIADAKYAKRVGDKSDGPDRKKWEEHFADEFVDKTEMSEEEAKQAGKQAMKRVDRFNKYKKRTF